MEPLQKQLAASPVFSLFPPKTRDDICKLAIERRFSKSEYIVAQGQQWPYLLLVNKGSINAIKDSIEGRSLVAATFTKGDIFWGVTFFDERNIMPAALVAFEDSILYLWHRDTLLPFILQNGSVSWQLSRLVIDRLLLASEKIGDMTFQTVEVRLAKFLMSISSDDKDVPIERNLTLDEMAARIGTTREVVCRFLHKFSDSGIIEINRTEFSIKNCNKLREISQN